MDGHLGKWSLLDKREYLLSGGNSGAAKVCGTIVTESGSAGIEEDTGVLPRVAAVRSGGRPHAEAFR